MAIFSGYTFISFVWEHMLNLDTYSDFIITLKWSVLFFLFTGLIISAVGFSLWYSKLQKFIDQEQEYRVLEQKYKTEEQKLSLEKAKQTNNSDVSSQIT